jgi:choline dehydrogenase-like flavoprotein
MQQEILLLYPYVVDGSFFPAMGAVNSTLTIIANVLRVADHLKNQ